MKRLTHDEWYEKYKYNIDDSIDVIGKYFNQKTKILVKCKTCNKEYETFPSIISSGSKCKSCSGKKDNNTFIEELKLINDSIYPLEKYKSDSIPLLMYCKICKNEWKARPTHLIRGHGCPICGTKNAADKRRTSQSGFEKELLIKNPTVECIGKYVNRFTPILVRSNICGHEWESAPSNLIFNKSGCPICMMSHGESNTVMFLKNKNINYIPQKTYDGLLGINNGKLSYDFYLKDYNLLIECQGKQHSEPLEFFGGEEQFEVQQEHDRRKRQYANDNNIKLLEIWYYDFNNIEEILIKELGLSPNSFSM